MADFTQIIQKINDDINTNGVGAITGAKLNQVLRDMIAAVNAEKQDPLTIDATPTEDSTNPVQSGGVYEGLSGKQDTISDLDSIRSGAAAGTTAYQKPSTGIPETDLASDVQTSLGKADTAVQQVMVGTTTTGNAGTNASVTNSGTATAPVLDFTIPRGADGADGQDGADAVNPFKGWYASANALPANPSVGDYAYVKGANASDPAAIYECTTAGTWSDSGRTADTSNVQTFASGEEVNEISIDNDFVGGSDKIAGAEEVKQLDAKVSYLQNDSVKDAVWLSLVGLNKYMNQSGVIGTLNGYDLYEIKGLKGGDILIIRENNGNPVLATGLGLLYVCQGILQDNTYIALINYLKANGAELEDSSVFVFPLPDNIKSVYFTKKHSEDKDLSFIKVGGEILRGGIASDFPASLSDIAPTNIFDSYGGLVYPNPSQAKFAKLDGYEFAYAKLRAGDKVSFDNIDLTNLSTAGWVFSISNGVLTTTAIGLVAEYTATSDCYLCVVNKATNTMPVAYFLSKEFQSGIGKVLLQTDPSKNYKFVGCVLRNIDGVWQQIGGAHKSLNVASISQDSSVIRVTYNFAATNVVAFLTTPDEDFASIGYITGSSVGLQYADIRISQHFTVGGFVRYNGSGWDKYGDATNVVVQNNSVTIYHQNIGGVAAMCSVRDAVVCGNIGQVGTNFTQIMLYNFDGTPFVDIQNGFGIYFSRPYHGEITPANANQSGNIWCLGIMEA